MRTPRTLHCFLFLALLFVWAAAAFAEDTPMTKITIQVKTEGGRPVEQAEVVVKFVQGRSLAKFGRNVVTSYDLHTNQDGVAKIPSIPQGKIRIMINAKGYQTYGETLDIAQEEKTVEITLNPPQPQYSAH